MHDACMAKKNFTIRMDATIRQQLAILAVAEHRTPASMIEVLVIRASKLLNAEDAAMAVSELRRRDAA